MVGKFSTTKLYSHPLNYSLILLFHATTSLGYLFVSFNLTYNVFNRSSEERLGSLQVGAVTVS